MKLTLLMVPEQIVATQIRLHTLEQHPEHSLLRELLDHTARPVQSFHCVPYDFSGVGVAPTVGGCVGRLFVSEVFHKAFVAVDEEGTEAAAATAILIEHDVGYSGPPPKPILFHVDKPFLFVLKDQAGAALLLGRIVDPS